MKTVTSRGGQVQFLLPEDWVVEPSDNGIQAYSPQPASGTLRLDVLTFRLRSGAAPQSADHLLRRLGGNGEPVPLANGVWMARYRKESAEDGVPNVQTYWHLGLVRDPEYFEAIFSYTLDQDQLEEPRHKADLEMLEREVPAARFAK